MNEHDIQQIKRIADRMEENDGNGPYSTAERIAGALVNDRLDWLPGGQQNWHIVDALGRLGTDWVLAVMEVRSRDWNGRW